MSDQPIEKFVSIAREYCSVIESGECSDLSALYLQLAKLHIAVLLLPNVGPDRTEGEDLNVSDEDFRTVVSKLKCLPLDFYWDVLEPLTMESEASTACGSLVDDVADIWRDLKDGLLNYDSEARNDAVWHWKLSFETHWGAHLTGAIRVIHERLF